MTTRFDLIIIGGRCAGAALARVTASAGLRTLVVDRARFPSDTVSTHAIAAHGVELLDSWGLLDAVVATGPPTVRRFRVTVGDLDVTMDVPLDRPGLIAPRRTVLDHLLVQAARDAGAVVWEAATFLGVERDGERVSGIRCRVDGQRETVLRAPMVVGADGLHSAVADAVGAASYDVRSSNVAGVYTYYQDTGIEDFSVALAERRLLLTIPTNHAQVCLAFACHAADFAALHAEGERSWHAMADTMAAHLGAAARAGRRTGRFVVFKSPAGRYREPFGPGWALVGDAGHYSDPFTGQGIANAFLGAHLLGAAIIDGLGGADRLDDALAEYQHDRDRLTRDIHALTHDLAAFDWDLPTGTAWFLRRRELGDRLHGQVAALLRPAGVGAGVP